MFWSLGLNLILMQFLVSEKSALYLFVESADVYKTGSLGYWLLSVVSVNFPGFALFKKLIHKDVVKMHCRRKIH